MAEYLSYFYESQIFSNGIIKFKFNKTNNSRLTYNDFIELLKSENSSFFEVFSNALKDANNTLKTAYFWECPPVSKQTVFNKPFEFIVNKSYSLNSVRQNSSSFQEHFDRHSGEIVCSFKNLGGDATLIVPVPQKSERSKDYKNMKSFTENANPDIQLCFWKKVAVELSNNLRDGMPRWLSTNGLGVHYLHVRVDRSSKYYSFDEYKRYNENEIYPRNDEFLPSKVNIDPRYNIPQSTNYQEFSSDDSSSQYGSNRDDKIFNQTKPESEMPQPNQCLFKYQEQQKIQPQPVPGQGPSMERYKPGQSRQNGHQLKEKRQNKSKKQRKCD